MVGPVGPGMKRVDQRDKKRHRKGIQSNTSLKDAIERQRPLLIAINQPAKNVTAQGQSCHEGGQYGAHRIGGAAEHLRKHPHPQDLINET